MKTIPISFDSDIMSEVEDFDGTKVKMVGRYDTNLLIAALSKISREYTRATAPTCFIGLVETRPETEHNVPALVISGGFSDIVIAPCWAPDEYVSDIFPAKEPTIKEIELKYPVGSTIYENNSLAKVIAVDIYPDKILLSCEIVSGTHVGARFVINQDDVVLGVTE